VSCSTKTTRITTRSDPRRTRSRRHREC
jgi:hypothetical protein